MYPVDLPYAKVFFENGIVHLVIKEGAILDAPEMRTVMATAQKMAGKKPYLLFTDASVYLTISTEGRKIASDPKETPLLKANAVLVNNLPVKIIANFFNKVNKPHYKFKVFTDRNKALEWLGQFDPEKL